MKTMTRRDFLKNAALATAGTGLVLNGAAPAFALPQTGANKQKLRIQPQNKALVFIMLDGGNDSFNMLVPTSEQSYRAYQNSRSNLALPKRQLLPLDGFQDRHGQRFGIHAAMPEVQRLFAEEKLSFIANIGPMIEPLTREQFHNNSVALPLGLLSHADQFKHWQTSRPGQRLNQGWFGRMADALQADKPVEQIAMNISLAGSNILQNGLHTQHYTINAEGSVGLIINEDPSPLNQTIFNSFESLLQHPYPDDPFKDSYLAMTREAQAQHEAFRKATAKVAIKTRFADTEPAQQLRMVAASIASAGRLNLPQQTFFLRYIGWDHHDELLNNQQRMLRVLSEALGQFQNALEELDVADRVITFTGSDFGRTLTSNGNGTDHGWGGNTLVMGESIQGGKIFGDYPELTLGKDNPLDAGDGVLIPTTATDQLYAELAHWFGVARKDLPVLLPNLPNFHNVGSSQAPLGLVQT